MGLLTTLIIHNQGKKRGAKRERAIAEEAEAEANLKALQRLTPLRHCQCIVDALLQ